MLFMRQNIPAMQLLATLLVTGALWHGPVAAVAQLPGSDLLPTGTAMLPTVATRPAATAAAPGAYPTVQAIPTVKSMPAAGQCAAVLATGQQCGGNLTNALHNCTQFGRCGPTEWTGACCPAAVSCTGFATSGNTCWSCGGKPPQSLAVAAENAEVASPPLCTRLGPGGDFDYGCALGASIMFYEAQRSGKLPATNRIPWRGNSGLLDKAPNGAPLVGGWYDAGDLTRFTFPAAFTVSTLALGFLEFQDAFQQANQVNYMLETLKWGGDWLLAARYQPDAFVAVTWLPGNEPNVTATHGFWGRPEEVATPAAVRALVSPMKGADLLAQGAAALAAVSVAFQDKDPGYSQELLVTAQSLYAQATESEGLYSNSIPEVRKYYDSYSYIDDLAWAAAWLALRTGDAEQLKEAKFYWARHWEVEGGGEGRRFDYNNLVQGVGYLLAKLEPSRKAEYTQCIRDVMDKWLTASSNITYTPKGMAYIDSWGNLRYVANQAFMGLLHNKLYPDQSRRATVYSCFARKQARIMLGATGPSYVVGVGNSPPCRPHHRGASCVAPSAPGMPCDCTAFFNPGCNPNTIYGALVGGPNDKDEFTDTRWDFQASEVALDWNAGFTGLMAGLAGNPVSWDQCKAAGMEDGRGDISPSLNAAGVKLAARSWWHVLWAAGALVVMMVMQQQC